MKNFDTIYIYIYYIYWNWYYILKSTYIDIINITVTCFVFCQNHRRINLNISNKILACYMKNLQFYENLQFASRRLFLYPILYPKLINFT